MSQECTTPQWKLTCRQTYTHPAYSSFTLVTKPNVDPSLRIGRAIPEEILHTGAFNILGSISIDLTHISGENFVAYVRVDEDTRPPGDYEPTRDSISKAEFRLGEDGKVKEMGLQLEVEMGDDKIWFTKVE